MKAIMPVAFLSAFALLGAPVANAQTSKAAQWLASEQISAACGNSDGRFDPVGVIERDLTGDGQADLILDHGAIECRSSDLGSRSGFCGIRACSVIFYVRDGGLLKMSKEILSIGVEAGPGDRPAIALTGHNFEETTVRWNGSTFE